MSELDGTNESVEEVAGSLTGFDEIAIEKVTGYTIEKMGKTDHEILLMRAMAAVVIDRRTDGKGKFAEAFKQAQELTQSQLMDFFADEPDDVMPDDPDSEVGKGDASPSDAPTASLRSA